MNMIGIMSEAAFAILRSLATRCRRFTAGQHLFTAGDKVETLFLVIEGSVDLLRIDQEGRLVILQSAGSGEILAEASMFADRYHCDGVAPVAGSVALVPRRSAIDALNHDPVLSAAYFAYMATKLQKARTQAHILTLRTVRERLDAWLAANSRKVPERGSWHLLAREIGVSPEAMYRELSRRRRKGGG